MSTMPLQRRATRWVVLLALAMSALLPALAQALGGSRGAGWVEVCTVQGSAWVQLADDGAPGDPTAAGHAEHCPYCTMPFHGLGVPPAPAVVPTLSDLAHALPRAFLSAPSTPFAWVSAQPRAPPTVS
jgi:Protein of unknown function (DUF2946)